MAVLKVLKGGDIGQLVELQGERCIIGRHPNCRVVLDNAAVSRHHAQILENHGSFFLEDLRSRNGTLLNGRRIPERAELQEADQITVCDAIFSFHIGTPPSSLPIAIEEESSSSTNIPRIGPKKLDATSADDGYRQTWDQSLWDAEHSGDNSSVISTLNVASLKNLRLAFRPEVKLRAVLEISTSLGKTLNIDELLPKILDGLLKMFPQADRGCVLLKDAETGLLTTKATRFRSTEEGSAAPISMTIINQALQSGEAILSEDATSDQRFEKSESVMSLRIQSIMCVPLLGHAGDVIGIIQLDTRDLRFRFNQDDLELCASVACQSALAVENAAMHEAALKRRDLERELEIATQVQLGFLPTERPKLREYQFYDFYEAAFRVGGDFFDYVTLPSGKVAISVGDVAGKGIPAALLMARLYSMARYQLLSEPTVGKAISALNAGIASSGLGHRFITFVIGVLDPQTHQLTVVNAGHLPPLLRSRGAKVSTIGADASGLPLGVTRDYVYQEHVQQLEPGDTVLMFTDGVNEAMNPENEIYGMTRLNKLFRSARGTVEKFGQQLVADVEQFGEGRPQRDDICLVCFRRRTSTSPSGESGTGIS